jgi:hypothetical protein
LISTRRRVARREINAEEAVIRQVASAISTQSQAIGALHAAIAGHAERADLRHAWLVWLTVTVVWLAILAFLELIF